MNSPINDKHMDNTEHKEGPVARTIETQTAKIPSDVFLWLATGSIALSAGLAIFGRKGASNFVGHWPSAFLILGVYNKIVKTVGSDFSERVAGDQRKTRFAA